MTALYNAINPVLAAEVLSALLTTQQERAA